ncbi:P-loop NTPase family protein [Hamadaea tsunoensis]|uniref:hypothetical protein n=1 Tax=Hamadaea tsunoensis TaxID=53368 RepID=UPI0003F7DEAF|nr:hypothetical protein [Hamadaea tsunoensis]
MTQSGDVVLDGVRKAFGPVTAFDGVSRAFGPGTMTAVTGPGGSGRSTLLHLIGAADAAETLARGEGPRR